MPTLSPRVKAALIVATTAVIYVAAAQFRVSVAVTDGTLALVSPPTGITLSVVLLWGPLALPGVDHRCAHYLPDARVADGLRRDRGNRERARSGARELSASPGERAHDVRSRRRCGAAVACSPW